MLKNPLFAEDNGDSGSSKDFYFQGGMEDGSSSSAAPPPPPPPPPPLPSNLFSSGPRPPSVPSSTTSSVTKTTDNTEERQPPSLAFSLVPKQDFTDQDSSNQQNAEEKHTPPVALSLIPNHDSTPRKSALRSPSIEGSLSSYSPSTASQVENVQRQVSFTPGTVDNELTAKKYAKDSIGGPPPVDRHSPPIYDVADAGQPFPETSPETGEGIPTRELAKPLGMHIQTISLTDDHEIPSGMQTSGGSTQIQPASQSTGSGFTASVSPSPEPPAPAGQFRQQGSDNVRIETVRFYVDEQGREVDTHKYPQWSHSLPTSGGQGQGQSGNYHSATLPYIGTSSVPGFSPLSTQQPVGPYVSKTTSSGQDWNGYPTSTPLPLGGNYVTQSVTPQQPAGPYVSRTTYGSPVEASPFSTAPTLPAEIKSGPTSTVMIGAGLASTTIPRFARPPSTPVSISTDPRLQGTSYTNYPREITIQQPAMTNSKGVKNGYVPPTVITIGNGLEETEKGKSVQVMQEKPKANGTANYNHQANGGDHLPHRHNGADHPPYPYNIPPPTHMPQGQKFSSHCKILTGILLVLIAIGIGVGVGILAVMYGS